MKELIIFMASCGPNVFEKNIKETYDSLSQNINMNDFMFYIVVDNPNTKKFIEGLIPEEHLKDIVYTKDSWAIDFNSFLSLYGTSKEFKYLLIIHDDILIKTYDFYNKTMNGITGSEDKIGWITYTNAHYHCANTHNSVRGFIYKDRKISAQFECHKNNGTQEYPNGPVIVSGPYSHFNLIRMDHMFKIGPCADWTKYTMLIDEDWCLESLIKGFINVWIPDIFYDHPNSNQIFMRQFDLRFEQEGHRGFINKWGFDENTSDEIINNVILKRYPQLSYLNRYSYEYLYLKDYSL